MKITNLVWGIIFLTGISASAADGLVQCVDPKVKNGPVILSYSIAGTASSRLESDVTVNGTIASSSQVAQYKATKTELFLLIDDAATNTTPIYQFQAGDGKTNVKNSCEAQLTTYKNGKVSSTKALKCWITNY